MGAGQTLARGTRYTGESPVGQTSRTMFLSTTCPSLHLERHNNGKHLSSVFIARGTGNSPWKRQAFQSRVESTFQTHQLKQSPDVHPHHCARPMCVSERFLETLRLLEHPSEGPLVCDAGTRGNTMSVSMGLERVCRKFETIHQPSAAEQLASSLALGKEHIIF